MYKKALGTLWPCRLMRTVRNIGPVGQFESSPGSITMLLRSSLAIEWCIYTSVAS